MLRLSPILFIFICACTTLRQTWPKSNEMTGSEYYRIAASYNWKQRDSLTEALILIGNMPDFLRRFVRIKTKQTDSLTGKSIKTIFWVAPDYLAVGTNKDWARVHVTSRLAQRLADSLHCNLPTTEMVDQIYAAARVKLEPIPMYAYRDSTPTFWQHHETCERQKKVERVKACSLLRSDPGHRSKSLFDQMLAAHLNSADSDLFHFQKQPVLQITPARQ